MNGNKMMKTILLIFAFAFCLTKAAPAEEQEIVPIVSQESDIYPDGHYSYSFESADGSFQEQKGSTKLVGDVSILSIEGKYTYKDSEGEIHTITYTADETGYHPVGDLPEAPPIPDLIAKSLSYLSELPHKEGEK